MCKWYFSHALRVGQYILKRLAAAIAIGHALEKFKDVLDEKTNRCAGTSQGIARFNTATSREVGIFSSLVRREIRAR
jgi:hypothetical protein